MPEHKTDVQGTSVFGPTWYQAFCSCGWIGSKSYQVKRKAQDDADEHVRQMGDDE